MAEQTSSVIGRTVPMEAVLGASMHGVTGYEASNYVRDNFEDVQAMDRWGRPYALPVDSEHKAKKLKILSFCQPHMAAFHLSWFGFFATFFGTFAPAALISIIRENLDLTKPQVGNANVASIVGTIAARVIMGMICDAYGPRIAHATILLVVSPAVLCMSMVQDAGGLVACRFFIGLSLATFVSNQYWVSGMFSPCIIGLANGLAVGWGNSGGGWTHLIIPQVYHSLHYALNWESFQAWRWAFFMPGVMFIFSSTLCLLFGEDTPDGPYKLLKARGTMKKVDAKRVFWYGVSNYRTWIITLSYGFSFGVELTMDNIATQYFTDYFDLEVHKAGQIGACFGLMAVIAPGLGGWISDKLAQRFGIRGRIWNLWFAQTMGGVFSILMHTQTNSFAGSVGVIVACAFFTVYSTGATFGLTPFTTKRALGIVSGFVGAGGCAGASIIQALFFTSTKYTLDEGMFNMGIMTIACSLPILSLWWPQWGGAFLPARKGATEEQYYLKDYSIEEIKQGDALVALKFAAESRRQRGEKQAEEYEKSLHGGSGYYVGSHAGSSIHSGRSFAPLLDAPAKDSPGPSTNANAAQ